MPSWRCLVIPFSQERRVFLLVSVCKGGARVEVSTSHGMPLANPRGHCLPRVTPTITLSAPELEQPSSSWTVHSVMRMMELFHGKDGLSLSKLPPSLGWCAVQSRKRGLRPLPCSRSGRPAHAHTLLLSCCTSGVGCASSAGGNVRRLWGRSGTDRGSRPCRCVTSVAFWAKAPGHRWQRYGRSRPCGCAGG